MPAFIDDVTSISDHQCDDLGVQRPPDPTTVMTSYGKLKGIVELERESRMLFTHI